ncbi:MAG: hypothetical protein ACRD8Z_13025 [Nitrososphaeraceae archaeon]
MYPENIKSENNTIPADEETIETIVELTDRNQKNKTLVKRTK